MATDPVCGMTVDKESAADQQSYQGKDYWFCSQGCSDSFQQDPGKYIIGTSRDS